MIVVDASAIVAILAEEPDAKKLIAALENADNASTSPISVYEAVLGLRRSRQCSIAEAKADVAEFLEIARVEVVALAAASADCALLAFERFGKGGGHPARLNLGDCFAYSLAKASNSPLLFKGDDFSATDLKSAD